MLTSDDLKQIRGVVEDVVETKLDIKLDPIKKDIKILKRNDVKIRKDLNMVIDFFYRDLVNLKKRTERIEERLKLSNN